MSPGSAATTCSGTSRRSERCAWARPTAGGRCSSCSTYGSAWRSPAPPSPRLDLAGVEHFLAPATTEVISEHRAAARGVFRLPGVDEYVLGYADRSAVVDRAFADRIVPGNNGMFGRRC